MVATNDQGMSFYPADLAILTQLLGDSRRELPDNASTETENAAASASLRAVATIAAGGYMIGDYIPIFTFCRERLDSGAEPAAVAAALLAQWGKPRTVALTHVQGLEILIAARRGLHSMGKRQRDSARILTAAIDRIAETLEAHR